MSDVEYVVRDLQRRLANMIKRGRIHSVDLSQVPPRVKVEYAQGVTTGWLVWVSGRASSDSRTDWEPPTVDEQVLILSESGELAAGVVVPAIHDSTNAVPSSSPDEHVTKYSDGTLLIYNRASHTLKIDVQGELNLHTTKDVTVKADGHIIADATTIKMNRGTGVVTGECICPFTGTPHADLSSTVFAGK